MASNKAIVMAKENNQYRIGVMAISAMKVMTSHRQQASSLSVSVWPA